jgi:hypothetical protein
MRFAAEVFINFLPFVLAGIVALVEAIAGRKGDQTC